MEIADDYADELLNSATALSQISPETQANLRRAISSSYYALFHLLIGEACRNWSRPEQRGRLARKFEHVRMLAASRQCAERYKNAVPGSMESYLLDVANAFAQLQEERHLADYDLTRTFLDVEVTVDLSLARNAFKDWDRIRGEQIAQDYLFSLLFKDKS